MTDAKRTRTQVRTANGTYVGDVGDFVITPMRNRVSDVINEDQRTFISLTNVTINDNDHADFVMLNKSLIESITQV